MLVYTVWVRLKGVLTENTLKDICNDNYSSYSDTITKSHLIYFSILMLDGIDEQDEIQEVER